MFMRTTQQNVFLILNRVPVTFVTYPELIRPSIPVLTHFFDQKIIRPSIPILTHSQEQKIMARKCTAEIVGNIQGKVLLERQYMLVFFITIMTPAGSNPRRYTKMCVISQSG